VLNTGVAAGGAAGKGVVAEGVAARGAAAKRVAAGDAAGTGVAARNGECGRGCRAITRWERSARAAANGDGADGVASEVSPDSTVWAVARRSETSVSGARATVRRGGASTLLARV
jgi:hypothetical protein